MVLTARKQQILEIIVGDYIRNPVPVSSESVAQNMPVAVSSATIRNDMAELEEDEAQRCADEHDMTLEDRVLGAEAVLAANPLDRLAWQRRSRAPSVHADCRAVRKRMKEELRALRDAYLAASFRFRAGEWDVAFPLGTFRPGGGFVAA